MRLKEKMLTAILLTAIFVVSGGIACTYSTTSAIDPFLAITLAGLVFLTVGVIGCSYGRSRMSRQSLT